jgi:2,5-diketo-D-gluconate reductase A
VVSRWLIQKEVVVIPKSSNMKRMNENFNVFDFELSADDLTAIKSLDKVEDLLQHLKNG